MLVTQGTDCSIPELDADGLARRLVHEIAFALVESSSPLVVEAVNVNGLNTFRVRTDADGFGRLIGTQGRTVRAIRTILTGFASKSHRKYGLDIVGGLAVNRSGK